MGIKYQFLNMFELCPGASTKNKPGQETKKLGPDRDIDTNNTVPPSLFHLIVLLTPIMFLQNSSTSISPPTLFHQNSFTNPVKM